jgi:hypothetical protein
MQIDSRKRLVAAFESIALGAWTSGTSALRMDERLRRSRPLRLRAGGSAASRRVGDLPPTLRIVLRTPPQTGGLRHNGLAQASAPGDDSAVGCEPAQAFPVTNWRCDGNG